VTDFREKKIFKYPNFMKIPPFGAEFYADGQTNRREEGNSRV